MIDFSNGVRGKATECCWLVYSDKQLIGTVIASNEEDALYLAYDKFRDVSGSTVFPTEIFTVQQKSRKRK